MKNQLSKLSDVIKDAFWPRTCIICEREENVDEGNVCLQCIGKLLPVRDMKTPDGFTSFVIGFAYNDVLRQIIHKFKFADETGLAELLGKLLADRLRKMNLNLEDKIIVPVPDHPSRRRERGYNPAELIAKVLARETEARCEHKLAKRLMAGVHQSSLTDEERKKTLKNAFSFSPPPPEFPIPELILFDDVIHTGTTLKRLRLAAKKAGWKNIKGICLCA